MDNKIKNWINNILRELPKLKDNKGIKLLHSCGFECAESSELLKGAKEIQRKYGDNSDLDTIFKSYKKEYYDTPRLSKHGNEITLIFEQCTCPLVKEGINNANICNCTVGYTKKIFETLFGQEVEIDLQKSILRGDEICKQVIRIKK